MDSKDISFQPWDLDFFLCYFLTFSCPTCSACFLSYLALHLEQWSRMFCEFMLVKDQHMSYTIAIL